MERVIIMKGNKVSLVIPEKQDVELWYKSINDLELNQFLSSGQFLLSREAEEEYYDNISKDKNKINFSIYLNTDKKVIGAVSLNPEHFHKKSSFGIWIFEKNNHEKGFGTEALKLLFEYAFKIQGMRKIDGLVYSNNPRALHVYKKLGFQEIGRYKNHNFKNGEFVDAIIIEMFKEEFVI